MLQYLLLLKNLDWKKVGAWGGAVLIVVLVSVCYLQHVALGKMKAIYTNPKTVETVRIVKVTGPVVIKTRIIEAPWWKETFMDELRGPVTEDSGTLKVSEPVFQPIQRTDRWLVGASLDPFNRFEKQSWAGYGGYSFRNRVDFWAGVTGQGRARVLVMLRF